MRKEIDRVFTVFAFQLLPASEGDPASKVGEEHFNNIWDSSLIIASLLKGDEV